MHQPRKIVWIALLSLLFGAGPVAGRGDHFGVEPAPPPTRPDAGASLPSGCPAAVVATFRANRCSSCHADAIVAGAIVAGNGGTLRLGELRR